MSIKPFPSFVPGRPPVPTPVTQDSPIETDVLTQAEYEVFRDALPTWRDRLIAMLLRDSGLRVHDLLTLEVGHCALDGPSFIIYIRRSKKKNVTTYESVYIIPALGAELRDYINGRSMTQTEQVFGKAGSIRGSNKTTARGLRLVFAKAGNDSLGRPVLPQDCGSSLV